MSIEQQRVVKTTPQKHKQASPNTGLQSRAVEHPLLQLQQIIGNQAVLRLLRSGAIQAKLKIGQPDDPYEQEAEKVAEQVMRTPVLQVQRPEEKRKEEAIQAKLLSDEVIPLVQRGLAEEEVDLDVETHINASKGEGQSLPTALRNFYEIYFGQDFSTVRVHTDSQTASAARALNAQAFTQGRDIFFGADKFQPYTAAGQHLVAHELTHVVQQRAVPAKATPQVTQPVFSLSPQTSASLQRDLITTPFTPLITTSFLDLYESLLKERREKVLEHGRTTVVELKGQPSFEPDPLLAEYIRLFGQKGEPVGIHVRYGNLASGLIQIYWRGQSTRLEIRSPSPWDVIIPARRLILPPFEVQVQDFYSAPPQILPMEHPDMVVDEAGKKLGLRVTISGDNNFIRGEIGVIDDIPAQPMISAPGSRPTILQQPAFDEEALFPIIFGRSYREGGENLHKIRYKNALRDGFLRYELVFTLKTEGDQPIMGAFVLWNELTAWKASLSTDVQGLQDEEIEIDRARNGLLSGIRKDLGTSWQRGRLQGTLTGTFEDGSVNIMGTVTYKSKRINGELTLFATDESKAWAAALTNLPVDVPPSLAQRAEAAPGGQPRKLALTGWGALDFIMWEDKIQGKIAFIVDPEGYLTTRGTLRALGVPAKGIILIERKKPIEFVKPIIDESWWIPTEVYDWAFKFYVRAWLNLFGSLKLGDVILYDLVIDGVFSNHPDILSELAVKAKFNVSAIATAGIEAGGGIEAYIAPLLIEKLGIKKKVAEAVLKIKAEGILTAYLVAEPMIGIRESSAKGSDEKLPEYFFAGNLDLGGEVVLKMAGEAKFAIGSLSKEIEFGKRTYPFGGFNITLHFDHTLGSGTFPKFSLEKTAFNPDRFIWNAVEGKRPRKEGRPVTVSFAEEEFEQVQVVKELPKPEEAEKPEIPRETLTTAFLMSGEPHRLIIELGGPLADVSLKIATTPTDLFKKIDVALSELSRKKDDQAKYPEYIREQLGRRLEDLKRIRSIAVEVEEAARALGIGPEGIVHTRVPGFDALAEQLQIYGDRYGVEDLVGDLPARISSLAVPAEARSLTKNDYVVYHLDYFGVKGPHILRVDEVDVQAQFSGRMGGPPVFESGLYAMAAQPGAGPRDVTYTKIFLLYATYEKEWERLKEEKPSFISFHAFGGPGEGGQVIIDLANLSSTRRNAFATEKQKKEMGLDGIKYVHLGHLVADIFGGPPNYSEGNIVAMTFEANKTNKGIVGIEGPVLRDIKKNFAVYKYTARPYGTYPKGNPPKPPKEIEVIAERLFPSTPRPSDVPPSKRVKNE